MHPLKAMCDTNIANDQRTVDKESASFSDCLPSVDRTDHLKMTYYHTRNRTQNTIKENFEVLHHPDAMIPTKGAVAQRAPYENKFCFF